MTPTRARFTVLRYTLALAVITYLDRVAISSAAPAIRNELGLSLIQMGWVFSVFTFAYAAFEIPSGWLGDVTGPRKVLTRIVLWWSAFTMLTGAAWNFVSLLVVRFLFGVGEAGAFPNISRSFSSWFPIAERGNAHGVIFMGTRLGGALAPSLIVVLMGVIGWRAAFVVFGVIGMVWCVFWNRWFKDDPATHPGVNAEELEIIARGLPPRGALPAFGWRQLLSGNVILLCLMYFTMPYTLYFNLTWLPTYLKEVRGFTVQEAAYLSSAVLFAGAMANWIGGRLTDSLTRRYGVRIGRSLGAVTLPVSGLVLVAAALIENRLAAAALFALTLGIADLCVSACWAMCHDIGGPRAGTIGGAMNTVGNIGGAISPLVVGYTVQWWGSWTLPFFITAAVYVAGGIFTLLVDPRKSLWPAAEHATAAVVAQSAATTHSPQRKRGFRL
jgi:MFS transporter, ACS family, glucarate transporter